MWFKQQIQHLFCIVTGLAIVNNVSGGEMCYDCKGIAEPHDCENLIECEDGSQCFTDFYITAQGHVFYDLGCEPNRVCNVLSSIGRKRDVARRQDGNLHLCQECCNTGIGCNRHSCLDTSNYQNRTICYDCPDVAQVKDCDRVTVCKEHHICQAVKEITELYQERWSVGCELKRQCDAAKQSKYYGHPSSLQAPAVGRRELQKKQSSFFPIFECYYCCEDNYCNHEECIKGAAANPTTPTTKATPIPTTPTTKATPIPTTPTTKATPKPTTPIPTTPTTKATPIPTTPIPTTPTTKATPIPTTPTTKATPKPTTPIPTTPTTKATPKPTTPTTKATPKPTTPTTKATPIPTTPTTHHTNKPTTQTPKPTHHHHTDKPTTQTPKPTHHHHTHNPTTQTTKQTTNHVPKTTPKPTQPSGVTCYYCDYVNHEQQCNHTVVCNPGLSCYLARVDGDDLNDFHCFYKLGCMSPSDCSSYKHEISHSGQAKSLTGELFEFLECCDKDGCNEHTVIEQPKKCVAATDIPAVIVG